MAAEDYIDMPDYDFTTRVRSERLVSRNKALKQAKKSGKNKDIEWVTGQGEIIRLADMEDSHLGNTIRYIARKLEEHSKAMAFMAERGWTVPEYVINKRSGIEWLDILGKESNRREAKRLAEAKKVLAAAPATL